MSDFEKDFDAGLVDMVEAQYRLDLLGMVRCPRSRGRRWRLDSGYLTSTVDPEERSVSHDWAAVGYDGVRDVVIARGWDDEDGSIGSEEREFRPDDLKGLDVLIRLCKAIALGDELGPNDPWVTSDEEE